MSQQAVILKFPGSPEQLARSYAAGIREFQASHPEVRPQACFLGRTEREHDSLVVVLLWPPGTNHEVLGRFLLERLSQLGLPRPQHVDHVMVDAAGWDAISAVR